MAPLVPVIRRYLSARRKYYDLVLTALVILAALVALVAQAVHERRTYDLDRSARVIDGALADPANREALEQSRRADDIATDPGGGVTEDPRGGDRK